jgi:REP element-mobilizing transposase RayT
MTYYERNLPHWQPEGKPLFITWRLWGSLPASAWAKIKASLAARTITRQQERGQECPRHQQRPRHHPPHNRPSSGELFVAMDRELDRIGPGMAWLSDARVAQAVAAALRRGEELRHYRLHAFVVMPNHVHMLIEPRVDTVRLLKALEGSTASLANRILRRTHRPFWQDESFDHWVRNSAEFERIRRYIERNPVSAGLVQRPEDWPWSSAAKVHSINREEERADMSVRAT